MPVYFFWGEDDFALSQAVKQLKQSLIAPSWEQFNYHKITAEQSEAVVEGLNQALTPVFGMGNRLVWLVDTTIGQHCPEDLLTELERTLPKISENSYLLFTSSKKPDQRLKSTKLLQAFAQMREFSLIPPWKTEELSKRVKQLAEENQLKLSPTAVELLAESIGNNTRQLHSELEKLSIYGQHQVLDRETVAALVPCTTQNSLQLAAAIREGNTTRSLELVKDLLNRYEPTLKIVATLVGQFRTWTIIKVMLEAGEKDEKAIAKAAEINNPKRIYFLRKEVQSLSSEQLLAALPILLDLEVNLKNGNEPMSTLQTKIIQLCQNFSPAIGNL